MALRLSASLMVGIIRIHSQQTHYIYGTIDTLIHMCVCVCVCVCGSAPLLCIVCGS